MTLSPEALEETIAAASDYLQGRRGAVVPTHDFAEALARDFAEALAQLALAHDFAEALAQLADRCVVGVPCERHGGAVHGQEAEELRAGVEQILRNVGGVSPEEAVHVLGGVRKSLIFLLDTIDARDSLAFREATDPLDPSEEREKDLASLATSPT